MRSLRVTLVLLATLLAALTLPRLPQLQREQRTDVSAPIARSDAIQLRTNTRPASSPTGAEAPLEAPAGDNTLSSEMLRTRARQEFLRACTLAGKEHEPAQRQEALLAAVAEWATSDISAAANWVMENAASMPDDLALAALFDGGKADPAAAVAVARTLSQQHPARAADIAGSLIAALSRADEHELGAQFALEAAPVHKLPLLTAAYTAWGRQQPEEALMSALALTAADDRKAAFRATVSGWAKIDPKALAEQACEFPKGEERDFALVTALRQWATRDSEAAANFLAQAGSLPNPELILED